MDFGGFLFVGNSIVVLGISEMSSVEAVEDEFISVAVTVMVLVLVSGLHESIQVSTKRKERVKHFAGQHCKMFYV